MGGWGGGVSDCFRTMAEVRVELNSPHCNLSNKIQPSEHLAASMLGPEDVSQVDASESLTLTSSSANGNHLTDAVGILGIA